MTMELSKGHTFPVEVGDLWPSASAQQIMEQLLPEWRDLFLQKNADYGDSADDLGLAGQYSDIHRKLAKLRRALWDGKKLTGEQPREICMDLIGHLFLTIEMLDKEGK